RDPSVVIVTRALGEDLFPGETRFVGRTFYLGNSPEASSVRIVGVVEKLQSPSAPASEQAENSMIGPIHYLDPFTRYSVRTEPGRQDQVMTEVEKALVSLRDDRIFLSRRT